MTARDVVSVLAEVARTRGQQVAQHGRLDHPDSHSPGSHHLYAVRADAYRDANLSRRAAGAPDTWDYLILEGVYEALAEPDCDEARRLLVQATCVLVAHIEALDRRAAV